MMINNVVRALRGRTLRNTGRKLREVLNAKVARRRGDKPLTAPPKGEAWRRDVYARQNGTAKLTPRQRRRLVHKQRRASAREHFVRDSSDNQIISSYLKGLPG